MINLAPIRADLAATPGDIIAMSKQQLAALLDDAETGQQAKRQLKMVGAIEKIGKPTWCGYDAGNAPDQTPGEPQ